MSRCRWSSPATPMRRGARAQELTSVGLGDRLHHYPDAIVRRRAAARRIGPRAGARSGDPGGGRADRQSRRTTGKQIVDLLFTKHAERGMTLVLVTHDIALAQRCDRVVRLRSGRIEPSQRIAKPLHEHCRRTRVRRPRGIACPALRVARIARRPARLLRLHRLHRARRDGDRRRRLGRGEPQPTDWRARAAACSAATSPSP